MKINRTPIIRVCDNINCTITLVLLLINYNGFPPFYISTFAAKNMAQLSPRKIPSSKDSLIKQFSNLIGTLLQTNLLQYSMFSHHSTLQQKPISDFEII